uniref:WAP four-disulfide core domain 2 n=1 Tax=Peromyscus maniculatus bairdii TaxID=230844 RepID=A0A8C8TV25_PERMB
MPACRLGLPAAGLLLGLLLLFTHLSDAEKQGACPSVDFPKLGICEDQCQLDNQCPDNMKCCRNGCGKMTCATPTF